MYVTMVLAGLAVAGLFAAFGAIPAARPSRADLFGAVQLDYKLVLNILGLVVFVALFGLTMRRGVKDPVCGMTVDRSKALRAELGGTTYYFCSDACRQSFLTGDGPGDRDGHGHDMRTPAPRRDRPGLRDDRRSRHRVVGRGRRARRTTSAPSTAGTCSSATRRPSPAAARRRHPDPAGCAPRAA